MSKVFIIIFYIHHSGKKFFSFKMLSPTSLPSEALAKIGPGIQKIFTRSNGGPEFFKYKVTKFLSIVILSEAKNLKKTHQILHCVQDDSDFSLCFCNFVFKKLRDSGTPC